MFNYSNNSPKQSYTQENHQVLISYKLLYYLQLITPAAFRVSYTHVIALNISYDNLKAKEYQKYIGIYLIQPRSQDEES